MFIGSHSEQFLTVKKTPVLCSVKAEDDLSLKMTCISQGRVVTILRCGGQFCKHLNQIL